MANFNSFGTKFKEKSVKIINLYYLHSANTLVTKLGFVT